jgi:hypothetical protein
MMGLILKKLRAHLPNNAAYHAAFVLLIILEILTGLAIIWHFFFRVTLPLSPVALTITGGIYTLLALIYIAINFTGSLLCFKIQGFFYISVALFFLLKGVMFLQGRDFNSWGFYLMWVAILVVAFREMAIELGSDIAGGDGNPSG